MLTQNDLTFCSAIELAELIRRKKVSPVELVEAHLARIQELQPQLNAFVCIDSDRARESARRAEAALHKNATTLGPLHGVPVTIKSSINVAGLRCETGTRLRQGNIATTDAPLVTRLRNAGAIVLGNTNVPEMLMAYETDNLLQGRTNNPWDLERTAGGSSGGEAAAIAAGCSAGGVGSDSGGSIREPAHFSGICGLKPTPGRVPATGHYPECLGPFTLLGAVGPMARTVADLRLMFEVMAGPDAGDPSSVPAIMRPVAPSELGKIRVGYFEDDGRTPVTRETRNAIQSAVAALKRQGVEAIPFCPQGLEELRQVWWTFFVGVGSALLRPMFKGRENDLSPILREFLQIAGRDPELTAESLLNAWMQRDQLHNSFMQQMQEFPVLLCPVCSVPAFRHGERAWDIDGLRVEYLDAMSYTQWFNVLGNPGVVVPAGKSDQGLPIGVQVVSGPYQEQSALAVAELIEREHGWKAPPIAAGRATVSLIA